jgi:uncharacterized OB-fold protein
MSVPRYWRNEVPRYRLVGEECGQCGNKYFPARPVCSCGSTEFKAYSLAKKGEVVTWTVINNAPIGFEKYTPYMVALIELDDGLRLVSQLVDADPVDVSAGMKVEACFRKVKEDGKTGILQYGYKFRPVVE